MPTWKDRAGEARVIADSTVAGLRKRSQADLASAYIGRVQAWHETGPSGTSYDVEVEAEWGRRDPTVLRVTVGVAEAFDRPDEGIPRWRGLIRTTFCPATTELLVVPDEHLQDP